MILYLLCQESLTKLCIHFSLPRLGALWCTCHRDSRVHSNRDQLSIISYRPLLLCLRSKNSPERPTHMHRKFVFFS